MLRFDTQIKISEYKKLYEIIIPQNNILRKIKENIDFSFVNPMLKESYCEKFGRPAKEPELMFKILFLKKMYDLSDESLIQNIAVNMAYKYFLDLDPEDDTVNPSLLTKFRKTRITEDILEEMLKETVNQAIKKGLIKSRAIIVDATHSKSSAKHETPTQILRRYTKELRKEIYTTQFEFSKNFPEKPVETADLNDEINYSNQLVENLKKDIENSGTKKAKDLLERVVTLLGNDKIREIQSSVDEDAKLGHKSEANSFFGYKSHLAMTEERIITGIEVTTGEASDGVYLEKLIEQSEKNGIQIDEVIADTAYSGSNNLELAKTKEIKMISKLHPIISNGNGLQKEGFVFNKDADMFQCPSGHLSIKKSISKKDKKHQESDRITYLFDIKTCKNCPIKENCYIEGQKSKSYSVRILSDIHKEQKEFQETEYFKIKAKKRYMIEAKNAELKISHGLENADSVGVIAMRLQTYFTVFAVNIKRIVKLLEVEPV